MHKPFDFAVSIIFQLVPFIIPLLHSLGNSTNVLVIHCNTWAVKTFDLLLKLNETGCHKCAQHYNILGMLLFKYWTDPVYLSSP